MARSLYIVLAFVALLLGSAQASQKPLAESVCTHPPFKVHIFSKNPLIIYIPNFLTAAESEHLQEIT